jgi:hypothetical protein
MTTADPQQLLSEFIATYEREGSADPRPYLAQLDGLDRSELRALIEAFLERAPRRRWDPAEFKGSIAERAVVAAGAEGGWRLILPQLRDKAKLKRKVVVQRLAAALGFAGEEERVAGYYHRMEQGQLPPQGVSTRVLEALASILGTTVDALRRAGEAGIAESPAGAEVFTRGGAPMALETPARSELARMDADLAEPDELDRLFTGGD